MRLLLVAFLYCLPVTVGAQTFEESVLWPLGIDSADGIKEHFVYGLIQADNGDVLAFSEGRIQLGDDSPHHIVLKRSRNKGKDWLPSQIIVRSSKGESFANPTPVKDKKTGKLFLFYARNLNNDSSRVCYIISNDQGATWSAPVEVTGLFAADPFQRPFHLPGPGHGITLDNGRMLVQVWHRYAVKQPVADRKYGVSVIYSDDNGTTWKSGGYLPGVDAFTANESRLVSLGGTRILLDARLGGMAAFADRAQSVSTDGGSTWSDPVPGTITRFPPVDAGLTAIKHKGKLYLLQTRPLGPGRNDLAVSYSADEAKSWSPPKLLFKGPANYSDIIVLKDRSFLVLYGRGKPRYAAALRFDWNWLISDIKTDQKKKKQQ
ncbi:MAG: sialidase family protein [Niabella sp.]